MGNQRALPAERAAREAGVLFFRTVARRKALSVFWCVGLRRVDFRDAAPTLTSNS
jgi:hypothetical protein